jgi:hypothetical protein
MRAEHFGCQAIADALRRLVVVRGSKIVSAQNKNGAIL